MNAMTEIITSRNVARWRQRNQKFITPTSAELKWAIEARQREDVDKGRLVFMAELLAGVHGMKGGAS